MNFLKIQMKVINDLLNYNGLKIVQDTNMFSFSLDSVLLANFVCIDKNCKKILDIGCGNAPIPLFLSTKTKTKIIGVEIQKEVYNLAKESIEINKLSEQIEIINGDINDIYKNFPTGFFDVITCNPPFFKYSISSKLNVNKNKTIARHEIKLNLEQLFSITKYLLNNNGSIFIVHRPERVVEIFNIMKKNNIEPKRVQFIYPHFDDFSNIVLVEGVKNGKPGLKVLPPIISHDENGDYSEMIKTIFSCKEE